MAFTGWPAEAIDFYTGLEADNSKAYWTEHRETYEQAIKAPMMELSAEIEAEFGPLRIFRPYRDVRFSKDRSPYKTAMAAMTEGEGGEIYYVQVSAAGLLTGTGFFHMASDQLERHRAAIDDERTGSEAAEIVDKLEGEGYTIGSIGELKTAPRGYARDHPRVRLLRMKGLTTMRSFEPAPWLSTRLALTTITDAWRRCAPLNAWLTKHVGASRLAPPEAEAW
jgi:uncharacterized protein (TIGR02453 family)